MKLKKLSRYYKDAQISLMMNLSRSSVSVYRMVIKYPLLRYLIARKYLGIGVAVNIVSDRNFSEVLHNPRNRNIFKQFIYSFSKNNIKVKYSETFMTNSCGAQLKAMLQVLVSNNLSNLNEALVYIQNNRGVAKLVNIKQLNAAKAEDLDRAINILAAKRQSMGGNYVAIR
jgi:hypothetical protein